MPHRPIPSFTLALLFGFMLAGPDRLAAAEIPSALDLPPYLQPLSASAVVVTWRTAEPSYGWVEYGETSALGKRSDTTRHGLRQANVRAHRVVLEDLLPGTTYHYRVGSKPIRTFEAYRVDYGPEQRTEIRAFRTLPGTGQTVTAIIYNDLHNRPATLEKLAEVVDGTDADFTVFNGDCLSDLARAEDALRPLAAFARSAKADRRPAIFVRGNHETRGAFARRLPDYLAWPGDRPYFAFTAGPVRWVVLDGGEDKPDEHPAYSGLVDFESFRREQTEWLKAEVASPAFREATWRVLVHHIPLYSARDPEAYHQGYRKVWGDILADARVTLALNAHTHRRAFHPSGSVGNPYPVAVGGGPDVEEATVMVIEAGSEKLSLRLLDSEGRDVFNEFVVRR